MYYTYMLRCEDNSIYTGIAIDLKSRMNEHFNKTKKCAKYTLSHNAKKLEVAWESENKTLASKLEFYLKKLSKNEKEALILNNSNFKSLLYNKVDIDLYKEVDTKQIRNISNLYKTIKNKEI